LRRRNNNSFVKIFFTLIFLVLLSGGAFIYVSPQFEKDAPVVKFDDNIYWNLRDKLKLEINDESGVKFYRVLFQNGNTQKVLEEQVLNEAKKQIVLDINAPKLDMFFKSKQISIVVEASDNSKWNFFEGNKTVKTFTVNVDKKRPTVEVINNTYAIRRGGSALVITKIEDENLKDIYVDFGKEKRFELIPFYKENYYMALIGWPVDMKSFGGVNVVAIDKANNFTKSKVPLYIRPLKKRKSKIKISDNFINNISVKVLEQSAQSIPNELNEIFVKQNRMIREKNIQTIEKVSKEYMNKQMVSKLTLNKFNRLTNSMTAGYFAQRRFYYHDGKKIDEAWHLGVDWASVKRADIKVSNAGRVIFNDYLGIYGNTIIIDHGFGLQTLYAHTSSSNVSVGDDVQKNQKIANTGASGAVLGDHLHFGVLIQGVEVNPLEWMDKNWIKTRILDIIDDSKKVIDSK
jgi:murein DD-endopeptidase MepM/ murein hydrolase activator NlpD